jgi:hypothetical protein
MEYKILGKKNDIALIIADEIIIKDTQSALDMIASAQYETDCDKFIVYKSCVVDDFFVLSTGIAGEILQKFIKIFPDAHPVNIVQDICAGIAHNTLLCQEGYWAGHSSVQSSCKIHLSAA